MLIVIQGIPSGLATKGQYILNHLRLSSHQLPRLQYQQHRLRMQKTASMK
jgi:hypothetical protein